MADWSQFKSEPISTEAPQQVDSSAPPSNDKWAQYKNKNPKESIEIPGLFPNVRGIAAYGKGIWEAIPGSKYLGGLVSEALPDVEVAPEHENHRTAGQLTGVATTIASLATPIGQAVSAITGGATGAGVAAVTSGLTGGIYKILKTADEEGRMPTEQEIAEEAATFIGLDGGFKLAGEVLKYVRGKPSFGGPPRAPVPTDDLSELSEIGQKYGMRPVAATEIKSPQGMKPVVTKRRVSKIKSEIDTQTDAISKAIIKKQIPAAEARALGVNLDEAYEGYINTAKARAKASNKEISLEPVVNKIDSEISRLRAKSPNPSDDVKHQIAKLEELKDSFMMKNPNYKPPVKSRFFNSYFKAKGPEKIAKTFMPEDIITQFQAHNKNRQQMFKKSMMTGFEESESRAIEIVNNAMVDALEGATDKSISLPFRMSNEMFSQTRNLEYVEQALEVAMEKPTGLRDLLRNAPKKEKFTRALGEKGVKQLEEVGKYQAEVSTRLDKLVSQRDIELSNLSSFRRVIKEATTILPRIAGYKYTGKDLSSKYIRMQKQFLRKQYAEAEKTAEEIISNLPD